jgi:multiple sugar transport system permease protein
MKARTARGLVLWCQGAAVVVIMVFFMFPIVWLFMTSFKTPVDAFAIPPKLIFRPTGENYVDVVRMHNFFSYYKNTVVIAVSSTALSMVFGTLGAYALSRYNFRGKGVVAGLILGSRFAPPIAIILPVFIIVRDLHLLDTYPPLIFLYMLANMSFVVWLMRSFFDDVPVEIEEAARVDGCTTLGVLWRVSLPLARGGLATTTIFCIILAWNEFLWALLMTYGNATTLPVTINSFIMETGIAWGQMAAASVLVTLPLLIFAILIQKQFISGLTFGAIK